MAERDGLMGWRAAWVGARRHGNVSRTIVHDGGCGVGGLSKTDAPHVGKRVNAYKCRRLGVREQLGSG